MRAENMLTTTTDTNRTKVSFRLVPPMTPSSAAIIRWPWG
jgi:hypothetical protein